MASGKGEAKYTPDGPEAQRIARTIPYYPFKGIDRFYDIGGESPVAAAPCCPNGFAFVEDERVDYGIGGCWACVVVRFSIRGIGVLFVAQDTQAAS